MKNTDILAYTSGYIDGDGCFFIAKYNGYYRNTIYIVSTYRPVLFFFKKNFGGGCTIKKRQEDRENDKKIYHFTIHGNQAIKLAKTLLPFLKEKKKQAECFIKFSESTDKSFKDQYIYIMRSLKKEEDFVTENHLTFLKKIKETISPKTEDFPYIAGFIDAECSLGIYKYLPKNRINPKYKQTLQLGNTKLPCFEFFSRRFGGSFVFCKKNKHNHHNQISYKLSSKKLREILPEIYPFLKNKKKICKELLRFNELLSREKRCEKTGQFKPLTDSQLLSREKIRIKINHINKRGLKF